MAYTDGRYRKEAGDTAVDCELGEVSRPGRAEAYWTRMDRYLTARVCIERADVLMLLCCFVAGLTDSTVFNGKVSEYGQTYR